GMPQQERVEPLRRLVGPTAGGERSRDSELGLRVGGVRARRAIEKAERLRGVVEERQAAEPRQRRAILGLDRGRSLVGRAGGGGRGAGELEVEAADRLERP